MSERSHEGSPGDRQSLTSAPRRPRVQTRPRDHDFAILAYLGREQLATLDQVICRFWLLRGKGSRNGYRVVSRLVGSGLVDEVPLNPEHGGASRQVLRLTDKGWAEAGFSSPRRLPKKADRSAQWEFILQQTEVRLVLEANGWSHVPRADTFSFLRRWALDSYRGRPLTDTERVERRFLERGSPFALKHRVVRHNRSRDIRILVPIHEGASYRKTINQLPHFRHFPPIILHLISQNEALNEKAKDYIRRWKRKSKVSLRGVGETCNHRLRPSAYRVKQRVDEYTKNGVQVPHSLIRPGTEEP